MTPNVAPQRAREPGDDDDVEVSIWTRQKPVQAPLTLPGEPSPLVEEHRNRHGKMQTSGKTVKR
jgi:hypothetical protein